MSRRNVFSIPRQVSPYSGLCFAQGSWRATYMHNFKRKYKSMGTMDKDVAKVTKDAFYEALLKRGAAIAGTKEARRPRNRITVYQRKCPWVAMIDGKYGGCGETRREAVAAARARIAGGPLKQEPKPEPEEEDEV